MSTYKDLLNTTTLDSVDFANVEDLTVSESIDISGATLTLDQYDGTTIIYENNKLKANPEPAFDSIKLGPDRLNNTSNAVIHVQTQDTVYGNASIFLESDYDQDALPNSYDLTRIISTNSNMKFLCMMKHNLDSMEFIVSRTPGATAPKIKFCTNGVHMANDEHRPPVDDEYILSGASVFECRSDQKAHVIYGLVCPVITSSTGTVLIDDNLNVSGEVDITGELTVTGETALIGDTNVTGDLGISGTLNTNNLSISGTLKVDSIVEKTLNNGVYLGSLLFKGKNIMTNYISIYDSASTFGSKVFADNLNVVSANDCGFTINSSSLSTLSLFKSPARCFEVTYDPVHNYVQFCLNADDAVVYNNFTRNPQVMVLTPDELQVNNITGINTHCKIDNISIVSLDSRLVNAEIDITELETNVDQSVTTTSSPVFNGLKLGSDRESDTLPTGVDLHIQKKGDACIFIEADTNNSGESDNSFLWATQDGGIIASYMGLRQNGNATVIASYSEPPNANSIIFATGGILSTATVGALPTIDTAATDRVIITSDNTKITNQLWVRNDDGAWVYVEGDKDDDFRKGVVYVSSNNSTILGSIGAENDNVTIRSAGTAGNSPSIVFIPGGVISDTNANTGQIPELSNNGSQAGYFTGTGDFYLENSLYVDDIREKTAGHGVEIDGLVIKDGSATFSGLTGGRLVTSSGGRLVDGPSFKGWTIFSRGIDIIANLDDLEKKDVFRYMRINDMVIMQCQVVIKPSSVAACRFSMELIVPSNFTWVGDAWNGGSCALGTFGTEISEIRITADTTNDNILVDVMPLTTSTINLNIVVHYIVK